jgi:hypothetical protein
MRREVDLAKEEAALATQAKALQAETLQVCCVHHLHQTLPHREPAPPHTSTATHHTHLHHRCGGSPNPRCLLWRAP